MALRRDLLTPYSAAPPTEHPGGPSHMPSPDPQNTCGLGDRTPSPSPRPLPE